MANSDSWLPDLRLFFNREYKNICIADQYELVIFHEDRVHKIKNKYQENLSRVRNMMSENSKLSYIDRHKICALYIKTILQLNIFEFNYKKYNDLGRPDIMSILLLANEYVCFNLVVLIIESWSIKSKEGINLKKLSDYTLLYPEKLPPLTLKGDYCDYLEHFVRLLYNTKDDIINKESCIFNIAHTLFFLELSNDCCFYDLKRIYYNY